MAETIAELATVSPEFTALKHISATSFPSGLFRAHDNTVLNHVSDATLSKLRPGASCHIRCMSGRAQSEKAVGRKARKGDLGSRQEVCEAEPKGGGGSPAEPQGVALRLTLGHGTPATAESQAMWAS